LADILEQSILFSIYMNCAQIQNRVLRDKTNRKQNTVQQKIHLHSISNQDL